MYSSSFASPARRMAAELSLVSEKSSPGGSDDVESMRLKTGFIGTLRDRDGFCRALVVCHELLVAGTGFVSSVDEIAGQERPPLATDYVLSRYPVLKIHHTVARHTARKQIVITRLTPTLTSAIP